MSIFKDLKIKKERWKITSTDPACTQAKHVPSESCMATQACYKMKSQRHFISVHSINLSIPSSSRLSNMYNISELTVSHSYYHGYFSSFVSHFGYLLRADFFSHMFWVIIYIQYCIYYSVEYRINLLSITFHTNTMCSHSKCSTERYITDNGMTCRIKKMPYATFTKAWKL